MNHRALKSCVFISRMLRFSCIAMIFVLISPLSAQQNDVEHLVPEIVSIRPHDSSAFTEGLIWHDGFLYESSGQYGQSTLRQENPETGEVGLYARLADKYFGEGLALVDNYLYLLTWKEETAFRINLSLFTDGAEADVNTFPYSGEGWGLCYDDEYLYMSNGSDTLTLRDPDTFLVIEQRQVTYLGKPLSQISSAGESTIPTPTTPDPDFVPQVHAGQRLDQLNELECVDDDIYANVWQTDLILRIDKFSGEVTGVIDASGLLTPEEKVSADVLNGIAYLPDSDTFLITGKYWPKMFEVHFVPAA